MKTVQLGFTTIKRTALCTASAAAMLVVAGAMMLDTKALAMDGVQMAQSTETTDTTTAAEQPATETTDTAAEQPAAEQEPAAAAENTDADDEKAQMKQAAKGGDRDAALSLAEEYARAEEPDHDMAAEFALIALKDGGQKYAAKFIPNTRAWSRDFWRAVQTQLKEHGAYRGAIDGLPGNGTQLAVMSYAGIKPAAVTAKPRKKYTQPRKKKPRGSYTN